MTGTPEKDVLLTRLVNAPRERVWAAFTNPGEVTTWWGPNGYTITTLAMDVKVGGQWRFVMHGPDGTDYDNRHSYLEVVRPERLVFVHGSDIDDDPNAFISRITFADEDGKTRVTMQMTFATAEQRAFVVGFGAIELGYQTLSKLAKHLGDPSPVLDSIPDDERFVMEHIVDAAPDQVFAHWTNRDLLARWWGPKGIPTTIREQTLTPGGYLHYVMALPTGGDIGIRFHYTEITPGKRLSFLQTFADQNGHPARHPVNEIWPEQVFMVVSIEETDGKTKMTVTGGAWNASEAERQVYKDSFDSLKQGFAGMFETLDEVVAVR